MARREDGAPHGRLNNGGLVDPTARRAFIFDGKAYEGFAGDTLASALLANGVRLVGRSFKYHRPRGVLTAGSEEPNALVEVRAGARREPNTRATSAELFEGLEARSQNRWPSLAFDLGALNSLMSPIFVAGFYYKTFMWPASFWEKLYEPAIRRAAGLGRASLATFSSSAAVRPACRRRWPRGAPARGSFSPRRILSSAGGSTGIGMRSMA
jgi:sarcosine oxidase subunit alpha